MSIITPDGTLSYPHLFQPRLPPNPKPGQKPRYQCVLLFPKIMNETDTALLVALKKAALKALTDKWGNSVEGMLTAGRLRWPFRKDWHDPKGKLKYDPELWQCFISPWSEQQPGIVSRFKGLDGKPEKLTDTAQIYAGAIARVSVNPFTYEQSGNLGVNFGLLNVQKRGDGPRLDNRRNAEDEFDGEDRPTADLSADDSPPASMATTASPVVGDDGQMRAGSKLADLFS